MPTGGRKVAMRGTFRMDEWGYSRQTDPTTRARPVISSLGMLKGGYLELSETA